MRNLNKWHLLAAAAPLAATPLVFVLVSAPGFSAGGGEKDVLLVIPYVLVSAIFWVSASVMIARRRPLARWLRGATAVTALVVGASWVALYLASSGGVSPR